GHLPLERMADMVAEGERSGYRFLRRLVDEGENGANRFSRPGEALFAAEADGRLVGICGLNRAPHTTEEKVGRIRNVYVLARDRRRGIGRRLVEEAIAAARGTFVVLRLRAQEAGPARLYESLGFQSCTGIPSCTHLMVLDE